jgi:excinuclease ABC subunit C
MIGLAKREEEIVLAAGGEPIRLGRSHPALRLLQRIRDEAHRFAITRHRAKRSRRTLHSGLLDLPGIGPATARKLLRAFGSASAARSASKEAIAAVAGRKAAESLDAARASAGR